MLGAHDWLQGFSDLGLLPETLVILMLLGSSLDCSRSSAMSVVVELISGKAFPNSVKVSESRRRKCDQVHCKSLVAQAFKAGPKT